MNALQIVILAGAVVGAGIWLVVLRLVPAHPDLAQALSMLSPMTGPPVQTKARGWAMVGQWGLDKIPDKLRPVPVKDLALLGMTPAAYLARKIAYALVGLLFPGVVSTCLVLVGVEIPLVIPAVLMVLAALVGFVLPDLDVRTKAARARVEFSRTLACYVDLVALERSCGSGSKQALDTAAALGDSWVFSRVRECLDRSMWAGVTGWDGLRELGIDLDLADLCDVADIMRLSGSEGAGVYRILRAKARSMREGILLNDMTRANETNEKMSLPVSVLGIVFLAILIMPALLSMMGMMS
ncbi:MAG: hypothetical protein FWF25_04990 [Propionibacteriaceae bacterium]|nr:hypothetical protein [Propionibacteriaceae bacterium]